MKKDIEIPVAKDVFIALIHEWNDDFMAKKWNAYILNDRATPIEMVLVVSKGYDQDRKTSTMRRSITMMAAKSYAKIELVQDDVLELNNEFFVTFFADGKLFERKFLFGKNTVDESLSVDIPIIHKPGILGQ
ncbi:hypothetical protein [Maribacter polysaccharolyticus]|uniref:hypothetical protein n=1 Tax=Maribacter polysaccharolyticus TaxID=3020831 RepID=UPI00237F3FC0|nr:hypothetical protein [Maribacter polysaccharolyticus]MDE3743171.1 hypothetical protein [Maribacter polysaccharolyticus]